MHRIEAVSFFDTKGLENVWSGAVYQPKGYTFPKVDWMDIRDDDGLWIRPNRYLHYPQPAQGYLLNLYSHYQTRRYAADWWVDNLRHDETNYVACWCPNERAAVKQINDFGTYICHLSVVEVFINDHYQDEVEWVDERPERYVYWE